jgi:hypothetical protein
MTIKLGDKVRDTITGFKGIAIARSIWLTGCDRITIQPEGLNKEGKTFEQLTFDEGTVEVIKAKKHKRVNNEGGGPQKELPKYNSTY